MLYDGTQDRRPGGLRQALLKHSDVVLLSFTENLMTYALGRRVEYYDMPAIRAIVRDAAKNDNRMSSFILGVVNSAAFRMAQAPRCAATTDATSPRRSNSTGRSEERRMFITKKHISRRTLLRGMGATVALPLLEAMLPARDRAGAKRAPRRQEAAVRRASRWCTARRAARSIGIEKNLWAPARSAAASIWRRARSRRSSRTATT